MNASSSSLPNADEISLRDIIAEVRHARVALFSVLALFTFIGVLYGLLSQRKFEATTVLQPVSQNGTASGLGGLAAKYGGLASLVGINLPKSGTGAEAVAVLQSELLTQRYIQKNNLLPVLFRNKWNKHANSWKVKSQDQIPTLWMANRYFKTRIRTVVTDKKTGMVDLTIKWTNPIEAAQWANGLVAMTNEYLRQKAIHEAERNIAYLENLASKTTIMAERQVIFALMEQQIEKEMIARDRKEYALKVVDPAFAPDKPTLGGPVLWGALGAVLGLFMALIGIFGRLLLRAA
jgi:uncharacterized protein involved in exopolysaccharide biosynthesis